MCVCVCLTIYFVSASRLQLRVSIQIVFHTLFQRFNSLANCYHVDTVEIKEVFASGRLIVFPQN